MRPEKGATTLRRSTADSASRSCACAAASSARAMSAAILAPSPRASRASAALDCACLWARSARAVSTAASFSGPSRLRSDRASRDVLAVSRGQRPDHAAVAGGQQRGLGGLGAARDPDGPRITDVVGDGDKDSTSLRLGAGRRSRGVLGIGAFAADPRELSREHPGRRREQHENGEYPVDARAGHGRVCLVRRGNQIQTIAALSKVQEVDLWLYPGERKRPAMEPRGRSIREIARERHISRNTVRKILRSGEKEFGIRPAGPRCPSSGRQPRAGILRRTSP